MKKRILFLFVVAGLGLANHINAQSIEDMKAQKEVLVLNTNLIDKQIELEKEKLNNVKLKEFVDGVNRKSDRKTDHYSSSDPYTTVSDAKKTAKILKKAETANKDLDKSNNRIISYEAEIKKITAKLERMRYTVDVKIK